MLEARGNDDQLMQAYQQAYEASQSILKDLVCCLPMLRQPISMGGKNPVSEVNVSPVAKRMMTAATDSMMHSGDAELFITPMISVAGSVADHVLHAMLDGTDLQRAYVNNGGDIALWLSPEERFVVGVCDNVETGEIVTRITLKAHHCVHGIATSGWRGRSHSRGIADAVTVLAKTSAAADAAATLIANAIDLPGCQQILKRPACELSPDSDLGEMPVTVAVEKLTEQQISQALEHGKVMAEQLLKKGLVKAAYLGLSGHVVVCSRQESLLFADANEDATADTSANEALAEGKTMAKNCERVRTACTNSRM